MPMCLKRSNTVALMVALAALAAAGGASWCDEVVARAPSPEVESAAPADGAAPMLDSHLYASRRLDSDHPLPSVILKMMRGEFGRQPAWRLALLIQGLNQEPRVARMTAYSTRCVDGGGPRTRWGSPVRLGICAADPRHWGPGSVIWVDEPLYKMLIVEDTGGAVKGRDRFDISFADDARAARRFGVRRLQYIPLHIVPPRRNWGRKPADWTPPTPPLPGPLRFVQDADGPIIETRVPVEWDRG